jgi:DNA end-binding protein Ku
MMSTAPKKSWTGTLKLGFVTQPVAVYAAADSKQAKVGFNQLHNKCGGRLNQQCVCRACNETVESGDVQRGYEHSKGQHVVIGDEELAACRVENTKVIELKEFVPLTEVTPLHIAESAFIAPVMSDMAEAYVLIREALNGMAGIGVLCVGNKEKLVAVVACGPGLVLHTLRHASEIRDVWDTPTLAKLPQQADEKTVKMMRTLMGTMRTQTLDLSKYPNRYVESVQKLIADKVAGVEPTLPVPVAAKAVSNLADMLAASLAASGAEVDTL